MTSLRGGPVRGHRCLSNIRSCVLQKGENQQLISTTGLPSGIYFIQLYVNGVSAESQKVVIIR